MNPTRSDAAVLAGLLGLSRSDMRLYWLQACAEDPLLRERWPEIARQIESDAEPPRETSDMTSAPSERVTIKTFAIAARTPIAQVLASALDSAVAEHETVGTRIGRYKLLQKIGEGGFGAVWMAEQIEPIRRRVALKIVKAGLDTNEVIARFEVERQALALMDHPNIARVFDAGATPSGRPYFVMELVRGVPITQYCDQNRLGTEERLRLFIPVCQAVQHAHQKGVIHRDIKPSNILVTLHDGVPVPKVIDFGIAKATDKQLTEKTLVTQFHSFVGTPVYTSPEQMEMSGLDVDTRSDIYSLGVLLYELLSGRAPFDADALVKSGLDAMRRTIREVEPPKPSRRLLTLTDAERTTIAGQRGIDPAKLPLMLRGDLDCIVMHCLEKDRTRRYETANGLAADVQRHLRHEPVTARPASAVYRVRKFVRRHKVGVVASAAVLAAMILGLVGATLAWARERTAHARAVVAERAEANLRTAAELERKRQAQLASRTALAIAERLFGERRSCEAVAQLVRAARSDPNNDGIGPRLLTALAFRNFATPVGVPLVSRERPLVSLGVPLVSRDHPLLARYFTHSPRCLICAGKTAEIWSLGSGQMERAIPVGAATAIDVDAGEVMLATGYLDGSIYIRSLATGATIMGPLRQEGWILGVAFSPDGKWLASSSNDGTVAIWDATTGQRAAVLQHAGPVYGAVFSPDGTRVLTLPMGGGWRVWRVPEGAPITPPGQSNIRALAGQFSPDGRFVLVADNIGAQLSSAATGENICGRFAHRGGCYSVAFSTDGRKAVTCADDSTAKLWEVPSGRLLASLPHRARPTFPQFTPDGQFLLTGCADALVRVWDVSTAALAFEPIQAFERAPYLTLSPDGREFLTCSDAGVAQRWRLLPSKALPLTFSNQPQWIGMVPQGENASVLVAYPDRMQRFNLATGRAEGTPIRFPARVDRLRFAPDGAQIYAVLPGPTAELWTVASADIARQPIGPYIETDPRRQRFSADGRYFALLADRTDLRVWETARGRMLLGPIHNAAGFDFSEDGRWFAAGEGDGAIALWDLSTTRLIARLGPIAQPAHLIRFSPDGRRLATSSITTVGLWDLETFKPLGAPLEQRWIVRTVAFTRDSRHLLIATPIDVRIYDVATGAQVIDAIPGTNISLSGTALSEQGDRIATCDRNQGEVRVWESQSGNLISDAMLGINAVPIYFGFVNNDRLLAQISGVGISRIWSTPPASRQQPVPEWLLRLATAVAGGEVDDRAVFRPRVTEPNVFDELRRELAARPNDELYVDWGRWLLADPTTRPMAPQFQMTAAEADRFVKAVDGT